MVHVHTKISGADRVWQLGVLSLAATFAGGGRLVKHARGVDVLVYDAERFTLALDSLFQVSGNVQADY